MLDTLYGNSWRKNQHRVLSPMTEPKNRKTTKTSTKPVASSEKYVIRALKQCTSITGFFYRPSLTQIKKPLQKGCLEKKKPNLNNLQKPFTSPWMKKFEGFVDSESDSDNEIGSRVLQGGEYFYFSSVNLNQLPAVGLDVVRTKLKFNDEISKPTNKSSNSEKKENIPLTVKSDDSDEVVSTDDEYDQEIKKLEIKRKSILPVKNKTFLESLSGISLPPNSLLPKL